MRTADTARQRLLPRRIGRRQPQVFSPIRTLTVGPGISPDQSSRRKAEGVAGFHRRWGISPRPENITRIVSFTLRSCQDPRSRAHESVPRLESAAIAPTHRQKQTPLFELTPAAPHHRVRDSLQNAPFVASFLLGRVGPFARISTTSDHNAANPRGAPSPASASSTVIESRNFSPK